MGIIRFSPTNHFTRQIRAPRPSLPVSSILRSKMLKTNNVIIGGIIFHSISYATYTGYQYLYGIDSSEYVSQIWQFIFLLLLIMWIDNDSREQDKITKCFDYKFLIYVFSYIYIPYYFFRTRGFVIGSAFLLGITCLYSLWYIAQFAIYFIS